MKSLIKFSLAAASLVFLSSAYAVPAGVYKCPDIEMINNVIGPTQTTDLPPTTYWLIGNITFGNILFDNNGAYPVPVVDPKLTLTAKNLTNVRVSPWSGGGTGMFCDYKAMVSNGMPNSITVGSDSIKYDFSNCTVQENVVVCK